MTSMEKFGLFGIVVMAQFWTMTHLLADFPESASWIALVLLNICLALFLFSGRKEGKS